MENNKEDNLKVRYVTTDNDYFNSADSLDFYVSKGKVKILPKNLTIIVEDALKQGLLRDATNNEIQDYNLNEKINKAIRERKIKAEEKYEDTITNYNKYKKEKYLKELKQKEDQNKNITPTNITPTNITPTNLTPTNKNKK